MFKRITEIAQGVTRKVAVVTRRLTGKAPFTSEELTKVGNALRRPKGDTASFKMKTPEGLGKDLTPKLEEAEKDSGKKVKQLLTREELDIHQAYSHL